MYEAYGLIDIASEKEHVLNYLNTYWEGACFTDIVEAGAIVGLDFGKNSCPGSILLYPCLTAYRERVDRLAVHGFTEQSSRLDTLCNVFYSLSAAVSKIHYSLAVDERDMIERSFSQIPVSAIGAVPRYFDKINANNAGSDSFVRSADECRVQAEDRFEGVDSSWDRDEGFHERMALAFVVARLPRYSPVNQLWYAICKHFMFVRMHNNFVHITDAVHQLRVYAEMQPAIPLQMELSKLSFNNKFIHIALALFNDEINWSAAEMEELIRNPDSEAVRLRLAQIPPRNGLTASTAEIIGYVNAFDNALMQSMHTGRG